MCISGIYSLTNSELSQSFFATSFVKIELDEYTYNSQNHEVKYNDNVEKLVQPGEEVSLIPKINNLGKDCYIRMKVNLQNENDEFIDITNYLNGIDEKWKKIDEYYYFLSKVESKSNIELFKSFTIPEYLEIGNKIKLTITVDAIQYDNFEPDYSIEDPWYGTKIDESVENSYSIGDESKMNKIIIKYINDSNKDIDVPANFGADLGELIPGDRKIENINIKNNSNTDACYYVSVETKDITDLEKELLSQTSVKITNENGITLYEGNMLNLTTISLGNFKPGQNEQLLFEIYIPNDVDNKLASLNPSIIWKFISQYEEDKTENIIPEIPEDEIEIIENIVEVEEPVTIVETIKKILNPKTGDSQFDLSLILFFSSAIGLIIVLILEHKEKKKKNIF